MPDNITHVDIIGSPIKVGDTVVAPFGTCSELCNVTKLNKKMINVKTSGGGQTRRYPKDVVVVTDNPKLTLTLLYGKKQ